ncbi:hypothetical protein EYF80_002306 [Liparis tanakae]|uniref:Uncharacterized protein n=1 Tax=Liparis tanakae TaxID=230148 RepID=A0A4Z2JBJ2_9TELE|nr:hypothetical protein EYF80_002306 [Liparis tanakae]
MLMGETVAAWDSVTSLALLARMPKRRALARAIRRLANALKFFSSSEITRAFSALSLPGEQDELGAVLLQALHIGLKRFCGPVATARIDCDADDSPDCERPAARMTELELSVRGESLLHSNRAETGAADERRGSLGEKFAERRRRATRIAIFCQCEEARLLRPAGLIDAPTDSSLKQIPRLLNRGGGGRLEVGHAVLGGKHGRLCELLSSQGPLQRGHVRLRHKETHRLLLLVAGAAAQLHRLLLLKYDLLSWIVGVPQGHGLRAILQVYCHHAGLGKEQRGVWRLLGN